MNRHHLAALVVIAAFGVPADAAVTFRYFKQLSSPICISSPTAPGLPCPNSSLMYGVLIEGRTDSATAAYVRYTVEWTDGRGAFTTIQTVHVQRNADLGCSVDGELCNAPALWFFTSRADFEIQSIKAEEVTQLPNATPQRRPRQGAVYQSK